jgi:hypothetical protein
VRDLAAVKGSWLVIEVDQSLVSRDRTTLYRAVRAFGVSDSLEYQHCPGKQEPLLWVADAAAWCFSRIGEWLRLIAPLISGVRRVEP